MGILQHLRNAVPLLLGVSLCLTTATGWGQELINPEEQPTSGVNSPYLFPDDLHPDEEIQGVKHQDPRPLRPNEILQPQAPANTANNQMARNLFGTPQRSDLYARRSRTRLVASNQNAAPPMIGDFFGATGNLVTIEQLYTQAVPTIIFGQDSSLATGLIKFDPQNNIFGTAVYGGDPVGPPDNQRLPTLNSIGEFDNGGALVSVSNLREYTIVSGNVDPSNPKDQGPFTARISNASPGISVGPVYDIFRVSQIAGIASPSAGGGLIGLVKIGENTSPLPRDRVYFNYSLFDNATLTPQGINVSRFTPGLEKTLFDGMSSIEVRTPFATTLSSNFSLAGATESNHLEWGNAALIYKSLVYRDDTFATSVGLQVTIPTAQSINVRDTGNHDVIRVKNEAVHLMPFVGGLFTPNDQLFVQGFVQVDTATRNNTVLANFNNTSLREVGSLHDSTYIYGDIAAGYWLFQDQEATTGLTGLAPIMELHYSRSLQAGDIAVAGNGFSIGSPLRSFELLNGVVGANLQFGQASSVMMGYSVPIGGGSDQQFDGEFRLILNRRFGPQVRQARVL